MVYCYMDDLAQWARRLLGRKAPGIGFVGDLPVLPRRYPMNMPPNTKANTSDPIALARYNMIEQQIRTWNVFDRSVLDTLARVRREDFVPRPTAAWPSWTWKSPLRRPEAVRIGQCHAGPACRSSHAAGTCKRQSACWKSAPGSGFMATLLAQHADQVVSLESTQCWPPWPATTWSAPVSGNASVRVGDGARATSPTDPSMPSC